MLCSIARHRRTRGDCRGRDRSCRSVPRVVPGVDARADRRAVGGRAPGALPQGGRGPLLVRRLPLAARLLAARLPVRHRLLHVGHADGRPLAAATAGQGSRATARAARSSTNREVPTTSGWEIGFRAARIETQHAPRSSRTSTPSGTSASGSWSSASSYFESYDFAGKLPRRHRPVPHRRPHVPPPGVGDPLRDHVPAARRSTFSSMACARPTASTPATCPSSSRAGTRRSWRPTGPCGIWWPRRSGSASPTLFDTEPEQIRDALAKAGGNASIVAHARSTTSSRCTAGAPRASPTPTSRRGSRTRRRRSARSATSSSMDEPHDFEAAAAAARDERDARPSTHARSQLSGELLNAFDELLGHQPGRQLRLVERGPQLLHRPAGLDPACGGARWPWARPSTPITYDDGLFLFYPEVIDVAAGGRPWTDLQSMVTARHEYYDHYNDIRRDAAEGRRHAARQGRGPGPHRDLRHAPPLLRGPEVRRRGATSSPASRPRRAR